MAEKISSWFKEEIKQKVENIVYDVSYFSESWIDSTIVERESIIKEMSHFVGRCVTNRSQHLYLYGKNGCGKTFCLQNISMTLQSELEQNKCTIQYLNVSKMSVHDVISRISTTHQSKTYVQSVFILDEIERLPRIKHFISRAIVPFIKIPQIHFILSFSNQSTITDFSNICGNIDVSAFFEQIYVPEYTENDLFMILDRRFILSKIDKTLYQRWAIHYIAQQSIEHFQCSAYYAIYIAKYMITNYHKQQQSLRTLIDECITKVQQLRLEKMRYIDITDPHLQTVLHIISNHINISRTELYDEYAVLHAKPRTNVWMHKVLHRLKEKNIIAFIENGQSNLSNHYIQLLIDPKSIPQR